jgi:hypothetical protein
MINPSTLLINVCVHVIMLCRCCRSSQWMFKAGFGIEFQLEWTTQKY